MPLPVWCGMGTERCTALHPTAAPQTISYDQVTAVEQIEGHSNKKWIIVGVVAAVVLVVGIIAIHVKNHPLGNCCGF